MCLEGTVRSLIEMAEIQDYKGNKAAFLMGEVLQNHQVFHDISLVQSICR